jgi:4-aminobutyrate aminotransferase-like enzyme
MTRGKDRSLELWQKYGRHVLMAMPYDDSLIAESTGCILRDTDGNEILDLSAGQFCSILGNGHPKYVEKIVGQMRKLMHVGTQFLSPIVLEAAAKLAEVAPGGLSQSILLSTGTEANECAISLAKACTGKTGVLGFNRGYYGLSLATKSLSSIHSPQDGRGSGPAVPESYRFLAPHCLHCPVKNRYPECAFACLQASVETLPRHSDIAAILVEPVFSAGGMFVPPPGYLKSLQEFAREIGALLILDEAQTGFGRTGKWFASEHHDLQPDILVVSKSAGAGFPVSAVVTRAEIADEAGSRGWSHLASHQSDPIAAAALAATIDIVREENLVAKAAVDGQYFLNRLSEVKAKYPAILDVRGIGLMLGIEIGSANGISGHELCMLIVALCESRGVHLTYTYFEPVIRFLPALTITREQIELAVSVLDESVGSALAGDVTLRSLQPSNPYTRSFLDARGPKNTLRRIASRIYNSPPRSWVQTMLEAVRKQS